MKRRFWKKATALILTASVMLTAVPAFAVEDELVGVDAEFEDFADAGMEEEFFEDGQVAIDDIQAEDVVDHELHGPVFGAFVHNAGSVAVL